MPSIKNSPDSKSKWIISLWSVVAAALVFNPFTFKATNMLGKISPSLQTTDSDGAITLFGWILHLIVFFIIVRIMMEIQLPGVDK